MLIQVAHLVAGKTSFLAYVRKNEDVFYWLRYFAGDVTPRTQQKKK